VNEEALDHRGLLHQKKKSPVEGISAQCSEPSDSVKRWRVKHRQKDNTERRLELG